jgi:uncharacterized protein (DUF1330 family)
MPAYLLAICEVTNPNENFKKYTVESAKLLLEHGGRYVVRGPAAEVLKGDGLQGKFLILSEWPDMETLQGFVKSPKYVDEVAPLREGTGIYDIACYESAPTPPGS